VAALIASAAAALLATSASENAIPHTLLLGSLTCSIIAASASASLLSTIMFSKPSVIADHWKLMGIKFVILLCAPAGWLSNSLLAFQAALLAVAWTGDILAAKIVITILIGFAYVMAIALPISMFGAKEEFQHLLGIHKDANHRILLPSVAAKGLGEDHNSSQGTNSLRAMENAPVPTPLSAGSIHQHAKTPAIPSSPASPYINRTAPDPFQGSATTSKIWSAETGTASKPPSSPLVDEPRDVYEPHVMDLLSPNKKMYMRNISF
jgi:hypothetical protein